MYLRRGPLFAFLFACSLFGIGCATGDSNPGPGPTTDSGSTPLDSTLPADSGAPGDATPNDADAADDTSMTSDDTGADSSADETGAGDTGNDVEVDAGSDSGAADSGIDSGVDVGIDTGPDAGRPAGCNLGIPTGQTFSSTMVGCAGKVTWDQRGGMCIGGWTPCTAAEWASLRGGATPSHDYWTDDGLKYNGASTACFASKTVGNTCATSPFHVCASTAADPEGNGCNWANCGLDATSPDQYFGGGCSNSTAGGLCCLPPCAAGSTAMEVFGKGVFGCAGSVTYANRATLCGNGYRACGAAEWMAGFGGVAPTHNYWTNDDLKYSGTGANACSVSLTAGTDCGATPMRVCGAPTDAEGNVCNWYNCGYEANTPNEYFGGCFGNTNAGTLCCPE